MRRGVFLALLLAASARAEPDTFGLGDGHDGDLLLNNTTIRINHYAQLTAPANRGDTRLQVSTQLGFEAGRLVMVLQNYATGAAPASAPTATDLRSNGVGRFELARVAALEGADTLRLTAPIDRSFPGGISQVITVPEYRNVNLTYQSFVNATPFDGASGGVVALLATGTLSGGITFNADGAGYRGGVAAADPTGSGCTLDTVDAPRAAACGEGFYGGRGSAGAAANFSGGGGGTCVRAGGGGAAHIGVGGKGGDSIDGMELGGLAGFAVLLDPLLHLTFGSGGGAGHTQTGGLESSGGAGGGIIFIRAGAILDTGGTSSLFFSASGSGPPRLDPGALGGGGSGGTVHLRTLADLQCNRASAIGGNGQYNSFSTGASGGGGGGRVLLQGARIACSPNVGGGGASPNGDSQPGSAGDSPLLTVPYRPDAGPMPDPWPNSAFDGGVVLPNDDGGVIPPLPDGGFVAPRYLSTGSGVAYCGAPYRYSERRRPDVLGDGPLTWSLSVAPAGATIDPTTGELQWTPTADDVGPHALTLRAEGPGGATEQALEVTVECRAPGRLSTCSSAGGGLALVLAAWPLRRWHESRRGRRARLH